MSFEDTLNIIPDADLVEPFVVERVRTGGGTGFLARRGGGRQGQEDALLLSRAHDDVASGVVSRAFVGVSCFAGVSAALWVERVSSK